MILVELTGKRKVSLQSVGWLGKLPRIYLWKYSPEKSKSTLHLMAEVHLKIGLILCGGDKSSQEQDIRMAKAYWEDYRRQEDATVD